MANRSKEFLAFARLADWLEFPVGVLETDPNARAFTFVIKSPTGLISRRIPRSEMEGVWQHIELDPDQKIPLPMEQDQSIRRIIRGRLVKTVHTS